MPKIRVVTDTAADILWDEAKAMGVTVVPLVVNFGEETYQDRILDIETFWEKTKTVHPQSSQPPVGAFQEAFAPLVREGAEVLCITVTSKHSGTYNSAWAAAQDFGGKVTVFDSQSLSWGQRFQVEAAVAAAAQGKPMSEILKIVEDVRDRTRIFIYLDTIDYLERGGRAARFIGIVKKIVSFFNIKPILTLKEGELSLLATTNSLTRGLLRMEKEVLAACPCERIAILHTRSPEQSAKYAQSIADKVGIPVKDIPICETGAALSVHAGPGVIAVGVLKSAR